MTGDRKRAGRRTRIWAAALAVAMAVGEPSIVSASCAPPRLPHDTAARYVATTGMPSGLTGVHANIEQYDPYYSAYNGAGTNMTLMLVGWNPTRWAQIGWFKMKVNGVTIRESGTEFYLSPTQNYWTFYGSRPIGELTPYQITFTAPSTYAFYVSGTKVKEHTGTFTPSDYQMFGETHDRVDQMPGGTIAPASFRYAWYRKNGIWYDMTGSITPHPYYGGSKTGPGVYDIWDLGCPT